MFYLKVALNAEKAIAIINTKILADLNKNTTKFYLFTKFKT